MPDRYYKSFVKEASGVFLLIIFANLLLWGGLIWLALYLLQNFGVI